MSEIEVATIGPECFTDGTVICYKGENYTRQPQQVTTVRELHALPDESVVRSEFGAIFAKGGGWWEETGTRDASTSEDIALPATVLHVGGVA